VAALPPPTTDEVLAWWCRRNGLSRTPERVTPPIRREWNHHHPGRRYQDGVPSMLPRERKAGARPAYTDAPPRFVSGGLPTLGKRR
jgi:hypothetical protein